MRRQSSDSAPSRQACSSAEAQAAWKAAGAALAADLPHCTDIRPAMHVSDVWVFDERWQDRRGFGCGQAGLTVPVRTAC
jgi:hypothetical protein